MRGKVVAHCVRQNAVRITPAYAGKSKRRALPALSPGDHPRMCGEKVAMVTTAVSTPGSPPHVRGKELRVETCFADNGITPACAGKSNLFVFRRIEPKDHPRVCGEKPALILRITRPQGSPPRMRGKVLFCPLSCFQFKDHPRVCGEKISGTTLITTQQGSPPRMRGKAPSLRERLHWHRITPAYAGKSGISPGFLLSYRDHPRVCGEKESVNDGTAIRAGSPPRMRGKAGEYGSQTHRPQDHPRVCGEKG